MRKSLVTGALASALLLGLAACQTGPTKTAQQAYVDAGARKLLAGKVEQLYQNKTWVGADGWAAYYGADGSKKVKTVGGDVKELTWYKKDGVLCEQLVADESEACAPRIYQNGSEYQAFRQDGSSAGVFSVVDGNSMGL